MRARNIKPGFFSNEDLSEVPMAGRLLFIGLWSLADREGKLEDRPKRIKGEIFRFDDISSGEVDSLLLTLAEMHLIIRYEIDGVNYIKIQTFTKHQRPHVNEKPSIIPEPNVVTKVASALYQGSKPEQPKDKALRSDSLNPDSLKKETPPTPSRGNGFDPDFEKVWNTYPVQARKGGKEKTRQIWKQKLKAKALPATPELLQAIERLKSSDDWQKEGGKWVPWFSTFLKDGRWSDAEALTIAAYPARELPKCTPACPRCRGSGLYQSGATPDGQPIMTACKPREDGDPPGILVFDPNCPICHGDGFKTMGKCKCARTEEIENGSTFKPGPCPECNGSKFRRPRPGEEAMGGSVRCECGIPA